MKTNHNFFSNLAFDLAEKNVSKIALDNNQDYYKKIITPTKKELSDHSEFLKKNLKKNYF